MEHELSERAKTEMSRLVAKAAIRLAISEDREEEERLKAEFAKQHIRATGVDYGGDFATSIRRIIERAVVAAKREGVISPTHAEEGATAGAAHEATQQILPKALGLNVGGKIGIARGGDHIAVALYLGIGLLHLDDVAVAVGHRALPGSS